MHRNGSITALALPLLAAAAVGLTACSSGSSSGGARSSGVAAGGGASTVAVRSTGKGQVLTDAAGHTLYVSDQEQGRILCTSSACNAIWLPVTIAGSAAPTGPSSVSGQLGTLARPDGQRQVTVGGRPLYTFSFDHSAGATGGDGQRDSFSGTDFSWHLATATGSTAPASGSSTTGSTSGGGYGY